MAGYKRKTGKNRWRLEYMYDGEKYSEYVEATSPSEADTKLAIFVSSIRKGEYSKDSSMKFVELAQLFLDKYVKPNLSDTTYRNYKNNLNKYILDEIGWRKISSIKRLHIQEFANKLVNEYNLSSKTAKNYIDIISSIFNKWIEWDFIQKNVADKISIPKNFKKTRKKVVLYSYDEINSFIQALEKLEDEELKMAIYTSFYTGARRAEVMALTFNDIDTNRKTIDFNKNKIKHYNQQHSHKWFSRPCQQGGTKHIETN